MDARRRHCPARPEASRRRLTFLGAIIAGGRSRRFGSDKALALLHGKPLIAHVAERLSPQVDAIVVAGRDYPNLTTVPDFPHAGLGPLGGLCGALRYARQHGFDIVLTAPCDSFPIPDLRACLPGSGGVLANWPLFGLWPVALGARLERHLVKTANRSVFGWVAVAGVPELPAPPGLINFNRPADLAVRAEVIGDSGADP